MDERKNTRKIPYDDQPIIRQSESHKHRKSGGVNIPSGISNKFMLVLLCVLIVFNIVFATIAITKNKSGGEIVNNNPTYNIYSEEIDVESVASKALDSVVLVHSGLSRNADRNNVTEQTFKNMLMKGAGVIISDNKASGLAYILTCYHVIRTNINELYIMLSDSKTPIKATYVSFSPRYDLAVLKIENSDIYKQSSALACEVADATSITYGQGVVAIGNPLGRGFSVTSGVISALSELVEVQNSASPHRVMRISAPINEGNSGGGLFDKDGKLLGIVSIKTQDSASGSIDCIAYAINSTLAVNLAYNIIRNNSAKLAYIGLEFKVEENSITNYDYVDGKKVPYDSVVISSISSDSPLNGRVKVGDKVVGFIYNNNYVKFRNIYTFEDYAFDLNFGDTVILILEGDKRIEFKVQKTVLAD